MLERALVQQGFFGIVDVGFISLLTESCDTIPKG